MLLKNSWVTILLLLKEFKWRIKEVEEVEQVYLLEDPIEGIIVTFL